MNSSELIERVRRTCFFTSATHPDFTDQVILDELNDQQTELFGRNVVNARNGYWLVVTERNLASLTQLGFIDSAYLLHERAALGGLESVAISLQSPFSWIPLDEFSESEVPQFDLPSNQTTIPTGYVIRGDRIQLIPAPSAAVVGLQIKWYRRPSKLVLPQDGNAGSTSRGRVTSITPASGLGTCVVDALPFDMSATPPAVLNGSYPIDIVRGDYSSQWSEVIFSGSVTFSGSTSLSLVGSQQLRSFGTSNNVIANSGNGPVTSDFVRLADTSDWPQLPREFHRSLADAVSIKILTELGLHAKAERLAASLAADLNRFQDMITPRTKSSAKDICAPGGMYRGNARGWTVRFP